MSSIKNEHIVWAYGELDGGGQAVIVGLTEQGLQYLRSNPGQTLLVNPPPSGFASVKQIVVVPRERQSDAEAEASRSR